MKLSSKDLLSLNIIDDIISEPLGGAHRDKNLILDNVRSSIEKNLEFFTTMDKDAIINHRKNKFLSIGRGKGFSAQTSISEKLSMSENLYDKLKKNAKIIYISTSIILLILISILFL